MRATVVGDFQDFAAASRAAAALMIAGFAQAEISIVGRDVAVFGDPSSRFAFAGAIAHDLAGAHESDFESRLVTSLARLCVPPREAMRHAAALADGGGLLAVQTDPDRGRRAEEVIRGHGLASSYAAGALPLARPVRSRCEAGDVMAA